MTISLDHRTLTCCLTLAAFIGVASSRLFAAPPQAARQSSSTVHRTPSQTPDPQTTSTPNGARGVTSGRQVSVRLQELRASYRKASVISDAQRRVERVKEIVSALETDLPTADPTELPAWLHLLQTAYAKAGRQGDAVDTMRRRYGLLVENQSSPGLVKQAADEAVIATFQGEFELAAALYDRAETLAADEASLFRVVLDRGRLVAHQRGSEAAVEYYRQVRNTYRDSIPELAHEAHYQIAQQYYRCQDFDHAIAVLETIQRQYPDTEIAEKARHTIRGWTAAHEK